MLSRCAVLFTSTSRHTGTLWTCLSHPVCPLLGVSGPKRADRGTSRRTDALHVHYVFPRRKLDVDEAVGSLVEAMEKDSERGCEGVVVVWDVAYDHLAGESRPASSHDTVDLERTDRIVEAFSARCHLPISFATIHRPALRPTPRSEKSPALRSITAPSGFEMSQCAIWYIGEQGRGLVNLQMTHAANPVRGNHFH